MNPCFPASGELMRMHAVRSIPVCVQGAGDHMQQVGLVYTAGRRPVTLLTGVTLQGFGSICIPVPVQCYFYHFVTLFQVFAGSTRSSIGVNTCTRGWVPTDCNLELS